MKLLKELTSVEVTGPFRPCRVMAPWQILNARKNTSSAPSKRQSLILTLIQSRPGTTMLHPGLTLEAIYLPATRATIARSGGRGPGSVRINRAIDSQYAGENNAPSA